MSSGKAITLVLNDPPYESTRSTAALRLVDDLLRRGHDVNVFAYEGAVALAFAKRTPFTVATSRRKTTRIRRTGSPRSSTLRRRTAASSTG